MKKAVLFVLSFLCAVTLVLAQAESSTSPGAAAKVPAPAGEIQANPAAEGAPAPAAPVAQPPAATPAAPPGPAPAASAAAPAQNQAAQADNAGTGKKTAAGAKPAAGATEPKAYVIGPLDVLYIKVWKQPDLSGAINVGPDGMISMQLIGQIKADGLTANQLRDVITQKLKECCVNNPEGEVDVQVAKNNSKRYYVYGGVLKPGEFPLDRDTSVMDALSLVGDFKEFANKKKIRILRGAKTYYFNYIEVSKGKHMEQNILLENGDRIFVQE